MKLRFPLAITGMIVMLLVGFDNAKAATTDLLSNRVENKGYVFAVPEGGWSTCEVTVIYDEQYTSSGFNNILNKRTRTCFGKTTYATENPYVSLQNISHRNSSGQSLITFSTWTHQDGIYPGDVTFCWANYNTTSRTYPNTTTNSGILPYNVHCRGAIVPTCSGSVTLSLRTN